MGRKEKDIDPTGGPLAEFARALRQVRQSAGVTYGQMAKSAHYSGSSLSLAAKGERLPTWPLTACYLKACGVRGEVELHDWRERWSETQRRLRAANTLAEPVETEGAQVNRPHSELTMLLRLLEDLRQRRALTLRRVAGRSLMLQHRSGTTQWLSTSRIHDVLHGKTRIDRVFIEMFLDACGASLEERKTIRSAAQKASVQDRLRARREPKELSQSDGVVLQPAEPTVISVEDLHKKQARYAISFVETPPSGFVPDLQFEGVQLRRAPQDAGRHRQQIARRTFGITLYRLVLACMVVLIGYSILR